MIEPSLGVHLNQHSLYSNLPPSRPSHHGFRNLDPLLIRKRDREREGFPWSHRQITRESSPGT